MAKLADAAKTLPAKPVADALLQQFLLGVRPIYPLVHASSFQRQYNSCWQGAQRQCSAPPDDPTFICLVAAVLYCAAATMNVEDWQAEPLKDCPKMVMAVQLRSALYNSLEVCGHQEKPTLHSLVSVLLAHSCTSEASGPFSCLKFVSMVSRIATSMGLHRDGPHTELGPVTLEIRRRVWWHILSMDAQATILNGSKPVFLPVAGDYDVPMVSTVHDDSLPGSPVARPTGSRSISISSKTSLVMLLATGHAEVGRFRGDLIQALQSRDGLHPKQVPMFSDQLTRLNARLDSIISCMPTQGIPERGMLPSRFVNMSPRTNRTLYEDNASEPTILAAWARIMLTMVKSEAAILFQKSLVGLEPPGYFDSAEAWETLIGSCITYLRNLLQMLQTPAFSPWTWYFKAHYAPVQCIFIILTYLQDHHSSKAAEAARYYADEIIELFAPKGDDLVFGGPGGGQDDFTFAGKISKQMVSSWRAILMLRTKIYASDVSLQNNGLGIWE
ncbi:hypothetical protein PG993_014152 [Apiospora rasikravindrae]|uniref:Xylanolytic transcriptional activator regulatory domain-containing protein n=1 Tax=Apiospora rasikravindrae TaxID=990691 RepID=A0ABR1RTD4_9PEZI